MHMYHNYVISQCVVNAVLNHDSQILIVIHGYRAK